MKTPPLGLNRSLLAISIITLTSAGCSTTPPVDSSALPYQTHAIDEKFGEASKPPSEYFDLIDWKLNIPEDLDGNKKADQVSERELANGYSDSRYFYTGQDGGLVFKCPIKGVKTSTNTGFTRVELREMLRKGNTKIPTKGVGLNNWVFSSAPIHSQKKAGGIDGVLKASVAVNHVTTSGDLSQVGRVIIGQIHANDDEPLRLYYRKLPNNSRGSIYFAHEPRDRDDQFYEMIGSMSDHAEDPTDGVSLNEKFNYTIEVSSNQLTVTISRPNKADIIQSVDMSDSGFDRKDQYNYFKADVYNQNNTGQDQDYVQATFYHLSNEHSLSKP